ncbi:MAG: universal stress protein [Actinobacteria bacterium]|nr:universal stress protein [Actinomycetota bacterium]
MDTANVIVVGVDGSETGLRALQWALGEARLRGAVVHAVTAWLFEPFATSPSGDPIAAQEHAREVCERAVREAVGELAGQPVVERVVTEGSAARVLVEAAADAAILVVGSHGHGRMFDALLGSVSADCVRHSIAPVVVVPPMRSQPRRQVLAPGPGEVAPAF